jgi:endogenous inhibitor of DNA gyrase (YacG/DUF329 family)
MNCPVCEKETVAAYKPFCSKRCADVDLAKWLNGSYALPSSDPDYAEALFEAMEQAHSQPDDPSDEKLH